MKPKNYLKQILLAVLIFGVIYLIIWLIFITKGLFTNGDGLNKSDWLFFLGGYLSFVGTITVTYLVIIQNKNNHEIEQERIRYTQLPYIKIKLADKSKLVIAKDDNYYLNYPSMTFENSKFIWRGEQTGIGVKIPKTQIEFLALYEIQNIGLGHAMKISINSYDSEYSYRDHLMKDESLFFIVDIASLVRVSQKITLFVKFCDVYNNKYQQKLSCEFNIQGTQFNFTISQEQFEPELLK
jgi:hypothetical protein